MNHIEHLWLTQYALGFSPIHSIGWLSIFYENETNILTIKKKIVEIFSKYIIVVSYISAEK